MKTDPDHDLRPFFQAQRRADHSEAPLWNPRLLESAHKPKQASWILRVGLPATAAAVLAVALWMPSTSTSQTHLSEALPVLLDAPSEPLFASLEPSAFTSPSDFLLPAHLSIQLP